MFDIDDMLDDGLDYNELWQALDACESALTPFKTTKGGKAIMNIIRSALDDIEMKEAMGEFDENLD